MPTDTRLIINGLDRAGDVLAEMAKREGGFSVHLHDRGDKFEFAVGTSIPRPGEVLGAWVSGAAETLPGAFLKFLAARAEKQAEIDKEIADRAAFEAFRTHRQQEAA